MGATVDRIWQYAATDLVDPAGLHLLLNALGDSVRKNLPRAMSAANVLVSPDTTTKVSAVIPFGVTYASIPLVITLSPITSGGIIVSTYAVSIGLTGFTIRYKASAATATLGCDFVVIGTLA